MVWSANAATAAVRRLIGCGLLWLSLGLTAAAHPAQFPRLLLMVNADGTFAATVNIDVLAYALGETSRTVGDEALHALLDGPAWL
jgi:hypothetical protein